MNLLLIGNGFDLAHGLNIRYGDFIEYININAAAERYLILKNTNIWVQYFIYISKKKVGTSEESNWIDFEKEILSVLKAINKRILIINGNNARADKKLF